MSGGFISKHTDAFKLGFCNVALIYIELKPAAMWKTMEIPADLLTLSPTSVVTDWIVKSHHNAEPMYNYN